jgi:hypothetical protein
VDLEFALEFDIVLDCAIGVDFDFETSTPGVSAWVPVALAACTPAAKWNAVAVAASTANVKNTTFVPFPVLISVFSLDTEFLTDSPTDTG